MSDQRLSELARAAATGDHDAAAALKAARLRSGLCSVCGQQRDQDQSSMLVKLMLLAAGDGPGLCEACTASATLRLLEVVTKAASAPQE